MEFEEQLVTGHMWRQPDVQGVLLCYKILGTPPIGMYTGGSKLFSSDERLDEALVVAGLSPSIATSGENSSTRFGIPVTALYRLGLDPVKPKKK